MTKNSQKDTSCKNPIFRQEILKIGLSWSKLNGFSYFFFLKFSELNKEQYNVAPIIGN